ncbi:hypothetical protein NFI96_005608 [Prochilodus magdalenae]|nr:hypothetical protein NFI96_005608 [Prochilodus magdalenae]
MLSSLMALSSLTVLSSLMALSSLTVLSILMTEVKALLWPLDKGGWCGPCQVVRNVHPQKLGALHRLHSVAVDEPPQSLPFVPFALVTVILLHIIVAVVYYTSRTKGPARVHYSTADGDGVIKYEFLYDEELMDVDSKNKVDPMEVDHQDNEESMEMNRKDTEVDRKDTVDPIEVDSKVTVDPVEVDKGLDKGKPMEAQLDNTLQPTNEGPPTPVPSTAPKPTPSTAPKPTTTTAVVSEHTSPAPSTTRSSPSADGCTLKNSERLLTITAPTGVSVLLPCSCTDLQTKPEILIWMKYNRNKYEKISKESNRYRNRVQLFNDHSPGNLSLLISHLTEEDGGVYQCAVNGAHKTIRLTIEASLLMISVGCTLKNSERLLTITAPTGGSVLLPCSCTDLQTTPEELRWKRPKGKRWEEISSESDRYRNRVQLVNDHSPGNLSLLISHLTEEDGGDYQCAVKDSYTFIRLTIEEPPQSLPFVPFALVTVILLHIIVAVVYYTSRTKGCTLENREPLLTITAHRGGSVLLPCSCTDLQTKPEELRWKRPDGITWVEMAINSDQYRNRVQLVNDHSPGNLSLLISHLTEEDKGDYMCAVKDSDITIRLTLKVCTLENSKQLLNITAPTGGSVLLPCSCTDLQTTPENFTWTKYIRNTQTRKEISSESDEYRNRVQLVNDHSPGNLSLLISNLTEEDGGDYQCAVKGSLMIIRLTIEVNSTSNVSIYIPLLLLLLGLGGVGVLYWRCRGRRRGQAESQDQRRLKRAGSTGCTLVNSEQQLQHKQLLRIPAHTGGSVLLPCYCTDLQTTPEEFSWKKDNRNTQTWVEIFRESYQYRNRVQLVNGHSPGNLSLLISHLTEEDGGDYQCAVIGAHVRIRLTVKELIPTTPTPTPVANSNTSPTNSVTSTSPKPRESLPFVPFALVTVIFLHIVVGVVYCTKKTKGPRVHYSTGDGDDGVAPYLFLAPPLPRFWALFLSAFQPRQRRVDISAGPPASENVAAGPTAAEEASAGPPAPKDIGVVPKIPVLPFAPEIPVLPFAPEIPVLPLAPETPDLPVVPETPDMPVVPETPGLPVVPETPDLT